MDLKKGRKLRDTLIITGVIIMLMTDIWMPFLYIGFAICIVGLIFNFLYNRCPHCGKLLGGLVGNHCQFCGKKLYNE